MLAFQSPKEQLQPPQDVLVFDRTQNVSIISMQIGMSIPWFQVLYCLRACLVRTVRLTSSITAPNTVVSSV